MSFLPQTLRWEIALILVFTFLAPTAVLSEAAVVWLGYHWWYAVSSGVSLSLLAHLAFLRLLFT